MTEKEIEFFRTEFTTLNTDLRAEAKESRDGQRWFNGILIGVLVVAMGGLAGFHFALSDKVSTMELEEREFKQDFGYTIGAMSEKHPESTTFKQMTDKYGPQARSGKTTIK